MTNYIKKTSNILWKALLVSALVFNSSCATEEAENIEITDNETPDIYAGKTKTTLTNAEDLLSKGTTYYIRNKNSGKVLDIENYGHDGETNVHQWDCYKTINQKWKLEDFDGNIRIRCGGFNLEIENGSYDNRANVIISNERSNLNKQKFAIIQRTKGSSQFFIQSLKTGRVLDVANYSKSNGGNVYQFSRQSSNNQNQLWEFYKVSDY